MDSFIFKTGVFQTEPEFDIDGLLAIEEIPGESRIGDIDGESHVGVWGSDGATIDIGGTLDDGLTMPRVLGFEDPLFG